MEAESGSALTVMERRNSVRLLRTREHSINEVEDPEQSLFYAAQMGYTSAVSKLCNRYRSTISPANLCPVDCCSSGSRFSSLHVAGNRSGSGCCRFGGLDATEGLGLGRPRFYGPGVAGTGSSCGL